MAEKLTDIELDSIALHESKTRSLAKDTSRMTHWQCVDGCGLQEDDIETAGGLIHVCVQGDRSKPAIITYHDIGMNSITNFQGFFNHDDIQPILRHFCVYHINAPGQQEGALSLPQGGIRHSESAKLLHHVDQANGDGDMIGQARKRASLGYTGDQQLIQNYQYPTMDQLARMILPVLQFYGIKLFIGFGVGAGANILSRFALQCPELVDALVLINSTGRTAGWSEWGFQKWNSWYLKSGQITTSVEEYLLWHWFGRKTLHENHDLVLVYSDYMRAINPKNLAYYIESFIKRTDLGIVRETDPLKKKDVRNFKCPVLMVTGDYSPHLDDMVNLNGRLDPTESNFLKLECGGMALEESPGKLIEAFRLFLQGMGYALHVHALPVPAMSSTTLFANSKASLPIVAAASAIKHKQPVC